MERITPNTTTNLYEVEIHYHVQIPARDGVLLSANLWLPKAQQPTERFPAILEMIPYRKDDWRYITDHQRMHYLAQRGFACCRLDVRGTGSSGGIALDEYTLSETQDGYDVVEWLAAQTWCNGNVGMWGISYGGFTAIQVATLQPPHLRAIVPMYATDDRYVDDVHYIGGCMVVSEFAQYAASQVAMNALPPNPRYSGENWQNQWQERLDQTPPWLLAWLHNQSDGAYWRNGSLAPDYGRITCAIFHIAGWNDGYVDCALRMHEKCLNAPRKTLIGNWVHSLPDTAYPGPNLDWLHEMVRFFDHWLKEIDNDVMQEPALVVYRRQYTLPNVFARKLNGEWIGVRSENADATHPMPNSALFYLHPTRLVAQPASLAQALHYPHRPTWGTDGSLCWGGGGGPNGLARDLRADEALALTFSSDPLLDTLDVLGFPTLVLHLQSSAPVAHVVVWLSDVAPDGTSSLVSKGVLNLTHRDGHHDPQPIDPSEVMEVTIKLRATCYRFLPGHRLRVTVASALWPVIWPSPYRADNLLHCGAQTPSRLMLPLLAANHTTAPPEFKTTLPNLLELGGYRADEPVWQIVEDVLAGSLTVQVYEGDEQTLPNGDVIFTSEQLEMTAYHNAPASVRFDSDVVYRLSVAGRQIEIYAKNLIRSSETVFDVTIVLRVMLDQQNFFEREWREQIKRNLC